MVTTVMGRSFDKSRKAFTLIELLVVIAIIALLMSIMMPTLGLAKRQAQTIVCRSNLRQWGLVWRMRLDENEDTFVGTNRWFGYLKRYYKDRKILLCPSAKDPPRIKAQAYYGDIGGKSNAWAIDYPLLSGDYHLGSFAINAWIPRTQYKIGGRPPEYLWKTPHVKQAGSVPLLIDSGVSHISPWHHDEPPQYDGETYLREPMQINEMKGVCLNRHPGATVNCLFLDFSTRRVGLKELWELSWHRKWYIDEHGTTDHNPPVWPPWMKSFKDYAR